MKVETHLRAGNLVDSAAQQANELTYQVQDFIKDASQSAESITSSLSKTAASLWNCLSSSLNL